MTSTAAKAKAAPVDAVSKPVDIIPTQTSQLYAHLQPIILLSSVLLPFKRLVNDPVTTLLMLAPILAIVQALYCILCLPSSGQTSPPSHKAGQKKKPLKPTQSPLAKMMPAFLSLILTLTLSAPILYITLLLFGAPLISHHEHTFLLALHLALLTTPHLFYAHGLDAPTWLRIASLQAPIDEAYGMSLGACVGAWVGAVPIPLDWDREWQKWPVTVVTGMYFGAVVGKLAGAYLFKGGRIKLS